jgi:SAM-dependent methyltransferase
MDVRHLPYVIEPEKNRQHYYETYWKIVGLQLLAQYLKPQGSTLLDYGCGRGEALGIARELGFMPRGTDADPECVRLASKHGPTELLKLENPLAQFGEKSFDAVCCFHVLEHVENPKEVLNMLRLIARKYVVLGVPNLRQLHGLFVRRIDLSHVNEGHLQAWDHWHLLNLAERHCGLKLVQWGFDNTQLPFLTGFVQKVFGDKAAFTLETGLFRKVFPFHGRSILGLFQPF